jgi:hypothetical protein
MVPMLEEDRMFWFRKIACPRLWLVAVMALSGSLAWSSSSASSIDDKKLKVEEVIAHHLAAIGSAEARAAITSRVANGKAAATNRIGSAVVMQGDGTLASTGVKVRFGLRFAGPNYLGEQVAYDGKRVTIGALAFGARSTLSLFLMRDDLPLREGLFGGVLSTAWPLLRLDQQPGRLEYKGLKKIKDQPLHLLNYHPRRGASGLEVRLYFEPETFRHRLTEYRAEFTNNRYYLREEFDDFRAVDGLMLPHQHRLTLSGYVGDTTQATIIEGGTAIIGWTFTITGIAHQQSFDEQLFTIK